MSAVAARQIDRSSGPVLPATAVVLGARNLGGEIARDLQAGGVKVASVARTREGVASAADAGILALQADALQAGRLHAALGEVARQLGSVQLVVNAMSPGPPRGAAEFGGGPIIDATMADFEAWAFPFAQLAFAALHAGIHALIPYGGTMIQIVNRHAIRADPRRGLIAAASAAARALTHAAAVEARDRGVHVALLIVDGIVESPKTRRMTNGMDPSVLVTQHDVARAVRALASQSPRGLTHEMVITPSGAGWQP